MEMIKLSNLQSKNWNYIFPKATKYYRRQDYDINPFFINGAIFIINKNLILKKN